MGELIAVLSGKGGTGKTSVCAGIASALAFQGESVLCIDCDVGLRNLDIALGISDLGNLSFLEVCRGDYGVTDAVHHPNFPTLQFLTAPIGCAATGIDTEAFSRMLQDAKEHFAYIFLDAPAGIDAGFELAARFADRILLVTGPDPAAVRDAARVSDVLELMGKQNIRIIVNRISKRIAAATKTTVDDIMDNAGLPLMGVVPEDADVTLAAVCKAPLIIHNRKGEAAAACCRIARRIQGYPTPIFL